MPVCVRVVKYRAGASPRLEFAAGSSAGAMPAALAGVAEPARGRNCASRRLFSAGAAPGSALVPAAAPVLEFLLPAWSRQSTQLESGQMVRPAPWAGSWSATPGPPQTASSGQLPS